MKGQMKRQTGMLAAVPPEWGSCSAVFPSGSSLSLANWQMGKLANWQKLAKHWKTLTKKLAKTGKKLAKTDKQANISQFEQVNFDLKSLIASESSNIRTDFYTVFLDSFPDVATNYQSRVDKTISERENMAFCDQNAIHQQDEELHGNVQEQYRYNSDPLEVGSDKDVCYEAIRSSEQLWNASDLIFGSFHQNDVRFSEQSRGYQCTCNALCMLSYAHCHDVENSLVLDKVLWEGDALYQTVIRKLKSDGKFIHHLLSLEEIPDDFELELGKFKLEHFRIESGPLVDTLDLGLPTLLEVLQSAFLSVSSGLLNIVAICSAVFKKKGLYVFLILIPMEKMDFHQVMVHPV